jgi:succinate dehydrogenase hydrophobic anchor subunit
MKGKLQTLFGLVLVLLIFAGVYSLIKASFHWFSGVDQSTRTAIIGATAVLSVPLVTYFANQSIERKRAVEQAMRLEKVKIYQSFTEFFMRVLLNEHPAGKPTDKEMAAFFADTTLKFITYGSNDVVKKWGKFRNLLVNNSDNKAVQKDPTLYLFEFETVLKALRKDLGHRSWTMSKGDIARLFINDIDDYLPGKKKK